MRAIRTAAAVAGVLGILLAAAPAQAGGATSLVLWAGGQGAGDPATGVLVKADGTAQPLAPANTVTGTVRVTKTFSPAPRSSPRSAPPPSAR